MEFTKRITIVGGGASGTLLAINLLRAKARQPLRIDLVERRGRVGRGVAFSTFSDTHLLNVPAGKMGAFPDDLEHFHRWLRHNRLEYSKDDFVPRRLFGDYLNAALKEAEQGISPGSEFRIFNNAAAGVIQNGSSLTVRLDSGESLRTDSVVLAFGNFSPPHPSVEDHSFTTSPMYFRDPWNPGTYEAVRKTDHVMIIGTGLSMVDVVLQLQAAGHDGMITAISTRGLLPAVHELGGTYPSFYQEIEGQHRITDIFKTVRRHVEKAADEGGNWRPVIDSLRPHTKDIWLNLPRSEKRYFLQHLSRYWNVARHRMPPKAAEIVESMRTAGQLRVLKGRLTRIQKLIDDGFSVNFLDDGEEKHVRADVIFNCIGSESDFSKVDSPLVRNLLDNGMVTPDELRLGLKATPDGNIIDQEGMIRQNIFTLGTALKGTLWETTAIPEIRSQARDLAARLLSV